MSSRARRRRTAPATGPAAARASAILARKALPMRSFSSSLPMALLRAREAVMRRFRPALRAHDLTEQQWRVLRALAHAGALEVTELAAATCILPPSLSRILPELEMRGYVSRSRADGDARRFVTRLEPGGIRLIAAHAPRSEAIYAEISRLLGPARLEQLLGLLRELEDALDEARAPDADGRSDRKRSEPTQP